MTTRLALPLLLCAAVASSAAAQSPVIGIWDFDESSGLTTADSGPYANQGALLNFTNDPLQWTSGVRGNALTFDGVDDHVQVAMNGGLPFYNGLGATFSICLWVKGQPSDDDRVLSLGNASADTQLFTFGTGQTSSTSTDKLRIYVRNDQNVSSERISDSVVFDGTWHHVAYVEASGQARLYVDGVPDAANVDDRFVRRGTRGAAHGSYTFDRLGLGGVLRLSSCCYWAGSIDDLRIFGCVLSQADVATVMAGTLPTLCRASIGEYGVGCGPGPLELQAAGSPQVGGPGMLFMMRGGQPNATALLNLGIGVLAPFDLTAVGVPGCQLYAPTGTMVAVGTLNGFGSSSMAVPIPIPNAPGLNSISASFQAITLAPSGPALSNAIVTVLGH